MKKALATQFVKSLRNQHQDDTEGMEALANALAIQENISNFRRSLQQELAKSRGMCARHKLVFDELMTENKEDEVDLATNRHNQSLSGNLHDNDFQRLKCIEEAIRRLDTGKYGQCLKCGDVMNLKRLMAVPWAGLCIPCQEGREREGIDREVVQASLGFEKQEESEVD